MCDRKGCENTKAHDRVIVGNKEYTICEACMEEVQNAGYNPNSISYLNERGWSIFLQLSRRFNISIDEFKDLNRLYLNDVFERSNIRSKYTQKYYMADVLYDTIRSLFIFTDIINYRNRTAMLEYSIRVFNNELIFSVTVKYCSDMTIDDPISYYFHETTNLTLNEILDQHTTEFESRIPIQSLIDKYRKEM